VAAEAVSRHVNWHLAAGGGGGKLEEMQQALSAARHHHADDSAMNDMREAVAQTAGRVPGCVAHHRETAQRG